jgi:hypothetical protein
MYYTLDPEVAFDFGGRSDIDTSVAPPVVTKLHCRFLGWLGDDLLESFPCFTCTERLKDALALENLTGFALENVSVSTSPEFDELYPGRQLPKFFWLKVNGNAGRDDFGVSKDYRLVVSERALECLRRFQIENCDIEEYRPS